MIPSDFREKFKLWMDGYLTAFHDRFGELEAEVIYRSVTAQLGPPSRPGNIFFYAGFSLANPPNIEDADNVLLIGINVWTHPSDASLTRYDSDVCWELGGKICLTRTVEGDVKDEYLWQVLALDLHAITHNPERFLNWLKEGA